MTDTSANEIASTWLAEMQSCVRNCDFARAREIFSTEVVGFGSRASQLGGLDALERDQWRHVWPVTRDFTFLTGELACGLDSDLVWIACPWRSKGQGLDGTWQPRPGRMTAVLKRIDGQWLAVHTHHSLAPAGASTSSR
jgi:ketosteroid isomerase-like protein